MTIIKPAAWEVWFANVRFEDQPHISKKRPVLVVDNRFVYILSLKISSQPPRDNCFGEYQLLKWQEAGLNKPSTVRISKKLKLVEKDFVHKIGRISTIDIINIRKYLSY